MDVTEGFRQDRIHLIFVWGFSARHRGFKELTPKFMFRLLSFLQNLFFRIVNGHPYYEAGSQIRIFPFGSGSISSGGTYPDQLVLRVSDPGFFLRNGSGFIQISEPDPQLSTKRGNTCVTEEFYSLFQEYKTTEY